MPVNDGISGNILDGTKSDAECWTLEHVSFALFSSPASLSCKSYVHRPYCGKAGRNGRSMDILPTLELDDFHLLLPGPISCSPQRAYPSG